MRKDALVLRDALIRLGPDYDREDWARYDGLAALTAASDAAVVSLIRPYEAAEVSLDDPAAWVPIHAWRAAGRRRLPAAIEPMLRVVDHPDDHMAFTEFPDVVLMIGPVAIDILAAIITDHGRSDPQRMLAAKGLGAIAGQSGPEDRDRSVAALVRQIKTSGPQDGDVNGEAAKALIALNAVSASKVLLTAYNAGRINLGVSGAHALARLFGSETDGAAMQTKTRAVSGSRRLDPSDPDDFGASRDVE